MYKTFLLFFLILMRVIGYSQKATISGQIMDQSTGEDLINATVQIKNLGTGTISNVYGFYSLTLEQGDYNLIYSFLGYEAQKKEISLLENTVLNIELIESSAILEEVVITAESEIKEAHIQSTSMSKIDIDIESVKKIPALFGEIDVIKAIQLLPGVKSIGEGSSGFYVRGGNADQNLVLLDEAPLYNPSHLLGFFSSFNPEAIKGMELYKGAIPARYGGRLSSVLDIRMKEGNAKRLGASGGIGSIMSRLAVEAPIGKNGSFIIAGRRSYLDLIAKTYFAIFKKDEQLDSDFFFYDLNAKVNFRLDNNNRIFASGYFGRDVIRYDDEGIEIQWGNKTGTLRWNHLFSPKLFSNLTYYYSNYDYLLDFEEDVTRFKWLSKLQEHHQSKQTTVKYLIILLFTITYISCSETAIEEDEMTCINLKIDAYEKLSTDFEGFGESTEIPKTISKFSFEGKTYYFVDFGIAFDAPAYILDETCEEVCQFRNLIVNEPVQTCGEYNESLSQQS